MVHPKQHQGGGNVTGGSGKQQHLSSAYALVEFADVDYAIQVLDGVQFDGRTLRVSKERTTSFGGHGSGGGGKKKGGFGFGSSRWAGSDFDDGGRGNRRSSNNNGRQSRSKEVHHGDAENGAPRANGSRSTVNATILDGLTRDEDIAKEIGEVIASEINESSDQVTTAIAATAAMSLLSSVDAFGLDKDATNTTNLASSVSGDISNQDFASRCKMSLSDLMTEYGEQDEDWKKQKPTSDDNGGIQKAKNTGGKLTNDDFQSRCKMPMEELMAEYGEQDVDWKKQQPTMNQQGDNNYSANNTSAHSREDNDNGTLAHYEKAFVHLELVSFGYKYGAPPHSKKGFTYAHPLPPIDVRDLDRAPGHVAKFNGLSYLVKRALLNPAKGGDSNDQEDEEEEVATPQSSQSPMRRRANKIADEVIKVLVESIDEGGHGPISPLTMTISIGSEYGRHRAVVLVEHLAIILRARLRRNDGKSFNDDSSSKNNGIVRTAVSVGTRHRDVDAQHKDEEAFGEDLKREARAAEKAKRRQENNEWGDDRW